MKILDLLKKGVGIAAFAAVATMSTGAHSAAVINCCFIDGLNTLQDSDADRILRTVTVDGVPVTQVVTGGQFQVGDVVESILRIDTVNSAAINGAVGTLNYGLWAYATLTINAITDTLGGSCDVNDTCIAQTTPVVEVYEDLVGTNYLTQAPATGIAGVQADDLILTLGLVDTDDFWAITFNRTAAGEISNIAGAPQGSGQAGLYVFGLSATSNPGSIPFAPDGTLQSVTGTYHDFIGDGSGYARETGVNSGWLLSTNTTVLFNRVPEPGSLALLGLGLAAASWFGGRRRKA